MFGTLGFPELIIICVIVLIIFGAGRLPQIGEGIGKALKGFKKDFASGRLSASRVAGPTIPTCDPFNLGISRAGFPGGAERFPDIPARSRTNARDNSRTSL